MGKGKIPDKKDDDENVKLKPVPEKQVIKFNWWRLFKFSHSEYDYANHKFIH